MIKSDKMYHEVTYFSKIGYMNLTGLDARKIEFSKFNDLKML